MFVKSVLFVAVAVLAVPVAAEPLVARQVSYGDLNLESEAGRATLQKRLVRAAKSMCATNPVLDSAAVRAERERCEAETAAQFETQVASAIQASRAKNTALVSR
jgi:UrcA family protein